MAGNQEGGFKAGKANKQRHGNDFYKRIGRKGGLVSTTGGFADQKKGSDGLTGQERARKFGSVGGKISRRKRKARV